MVKSAVEPRQGGTQDALAQAAHAGDAKAQLRLGVRYHQGVGVTQDYALAARWFKRAAEQGLADAQFNLGLMCYHAQGLPLDYVQAAGWYELAAAQGHLDAQVNLAAMHCLAEGVSQYDAEAARLCTLAAEKGNAGAQFNIGLMYANGKGVLANQVLAHMWLSVAISSGFTMALEKRQFIELNMTDEQIHQARRLELEWWAQRS